MYGITETTVHVTYRPLSWRDLALRGVSPIGIPIPDLQIYLLDSHKQTVPVGVPGEIYVGGAGVARGYLHHPDLTADRFIPNPFSAEPNARLYKSGDLARWNPEGQLEYLGRQDAQVKLRGYRIELGEIEAAIKQYSEIRQALIMVREDQPGDRRLVAYIVPALNATLDTDILRGFLREKLPAYMIPAAFVKLDTLPLTANGKIDRKALPAPEMSNWVNKEFVAPRSQTEQILSKIWMDILRTPRVSVQDSFFEVGGDSLLAIQAKWRIQDEFEITLPVQRIFEFPRLSDLAAQINLLLLFEEGSGLPKDGNDREEYIL